MEAIEFVSVSVCESAETEGNRQTDTLPGRFVPLITSFEMAEKRRESLVGKLDSWPR